MQRGGRGKREKRARYERATSGKFFYGGAGMGHFFPQHLVEGLLSFRRRLCRSFWLDLAFQDPPRKRTDVIGFFCPPQEILPREEDFLHGMP